ncbi:MAG: hypothetical protein JWR39_1372 [Devosia sp.]|jgi:hypothetical protein|nr:hypothetical protein [Devosia sp.]
MRSVLPASLLALALIPLAPAAYAAPVAGYESQYEAVRYNCSLPVGTVPNCETAINTYSGVLVTGGVSLDAANASFTAVRATVWTLNEPDPEFQADIDALFELLLPDSGALPGDPGAGFDGEDGDGVDGSISDRGDEPDPADNVSPN